MFSISHSSATTLTITKPPMCSGSAWVLPSATSNSRRTEVWSKTREYCKSSQWAAPSTACSMAIIAGISVGFASRTIAMLKVINHDIVRETEGEQKKGRRGAASFLVPSAYCRMRMLNVCAWAVVGLMRAQMCMAMVLADLMYG